MDTIRMAWVFRGGCKPGELDRVLASIVPHEGVVVRREVLDFGTMVSCCSRYGVVRLRMKDNKAAGSASFYGDSEEIFEHILTKALKAFVEQIEAKGTMQYMWGGHCNTIHFHKGKIAYEVLSDRGVAELEGLDLFLALQTARGRIAVLLEALWQAIRTQNENESRTIEAELIGWQQRVQLLESHSRKRERLSVYSRGI